MHKRHLLINSSLFFILMPAIVLIVQSESGAEEIKISNGRHIERASKYFLEGRYEEGILEAKKAVKMKPNDPRGFNSLVANYARLENYSEAIKASKRQLEIMQAKGRYDVNIVTRHAALLEMGVNQDESIKFLEGYPNCFNSSRNSYRSFK